MTDHLVRAAKARHDHALQRASTALREMARAGDPITFVAVARKAGVSTDFLYNTPTLRSRITELRGQRSASMSKPAVTPDASSSTAAIRALSTQLKDQRRRHREEVAALQSALAAAHGENLELRRRLTRTDD
ncbi:MAG: DUF6262 family protein [Actinomycetota bacterium]|nr:DUF6262 family protein [Actinomycetota bacterium]